MPRQLPHDLRIGRCAINSRLTEVHYIAINDGMVDCQAKFFWDGIAPGPSLSRGVCSIWLMNILFLIFERNIVLALRACLRVGSKQEGSSNTWGHSWNPFWRPASSCRSHACRLLWSSRARPSNAMQCSSSAVDLVASFSCKQYTRQTGNGRRRSWKR